MGAQELLFPLPEPTGMKQLKRKPADLEKNEVNKELAKRRYYLHKQLLKYPEIVFNGTERWVTCPYQSFEEIPIGARYYIKKLMEEYQYNIQLVLPVTAAAKASK